ncbi:unnamed protein product, partial [marine sediment metagenome]
MAIAKATIVTVLNARLKRSESTTSIAAEITAALRHLSRLANWPDLHQISTQLLTHAQESDAVPTDFRKLDTVVIFNA